MHKKSVCAHEFWLILQIWEAYAADKRQDL